MHRVARLASVVVVTALAVSSSACSHKSGQGRTTALDPDIDDNLGGTGIESGDVRGAAEQIARALSKTLRNKGDDARVVVMPVENMTRFRIDPAILQNNLVHDLSQYSRGRYTLVANRGGAASMGQAVLRTELRSLTKDNGQETSDYVAYFFALERPDDGTVLWTGMYETKRASSVDVVYR
ncbi:MAG TPA: hypothetical protein VGF99_08760 [Myxococcota bacterium]